MFAPKSFNFWSYKYSQILIKRGLLFETDFLSYLVLGNILTAVSSPSNDFSTHPSTQDYTFFSKTKLYIKLGCFYLLLEVCIPECHFPGTRFFPKKSEKLPIPSILEHPVPGPDSVLAFETGFFPACFRSGNIWGFPNASRIKN